MVSEFKYELTGRNVRQKVSLHSIRPGNKKDDVEAKINGDSGRWFDNDERIEILHRNLYPSGIRNGRNKNTSFVWHCGTFSKNYIEGSPYTFQVTHFGATIFQICNDKSGQSTKQWNATASKVEW